MYRREMVLDEKNTNLMTSSEAARLLNVHVSTVRRWSDQGILDGYRIGSRGDRRFKSEDVALLFESLLLNDRIEGYNRMIR